MTAIFTQAVPVPPAAMAIKASEDLWDQPGQRVPGETLVLQDLLVQLVNVATQAA